MCLYERQFVADGDGGFDAPVLGTAFRAALIIINNPYMRGSELACALNRRLDINHLPAAQYVNITRREGHAEVAVFSSWQEALRKGAALQEYTRIHYGQPLRTQVALIF